MTPAFFVYAIGAICVLFGGALILVRERLLVKLDKNQMKQIFGVEESVEVNVPVSPAKQLILKMRVHYPALLFLLAGVTTTLYAYGKDSQQTVAWSISGKIKPQSGSPPPRCIGPDCPGQRPTMTVFPTNFFISTEDSTFNLAVELPAGETFESAVSEIQYRHGCELFSIYPSEAYRDYRDGKTSPLRSDGERTRRYEVAVTTNDECVKQGAAP